MTPPLLAQVVETVPTASLAYGDVLLAVALLAVAGLLLLIEFLVVSFGVFAIAALGCAIAGIAIGFNVSPAMGWMLLAATPIMGAVVTSWGFRRMTRSNMVPKHEITENAGYRHATASLGIAVGAHGTLIADAMPTGRARFAGGDIDVTMEGTAALKGTLVTVQRIEGPTVFVIARA